MLVLAPAVRAPAAPVPVASVVVLVDRAPEASVVVRVVLPPAAAVLPVVVDRARHSDGLVVGVATPRSSSRPR